MNKLTKTAKRLDTLAKIFQILFTTLAIIAAVLIGLSLLCNLIVDDPEFFEVTSESLDFGFLELEITGHTPSQTGLLVEMIVMLSLACICCLLGRLYIKYIRAILDPMKQGQPFNQSISVNLKKIAILNIIAGIVLNIADLAEQIMMATIYDLPGLLLNEHITNVGINYSFDLTFVVSSAVLLLLSYVFSYGTKLQELSDETL
jgi:hypothetical protein